MFTVRGQDILAHTEVEYLMWSMLGLNGFANDPNWVLDSGGEYIFNPTFTYEKLKVKYYNPCGQSR